MAGTSEPASPFDFEEDDSDGGNAARSFWSRLLKGSVIFCIASFIASFTGSVLWNNARGDAQLESLSTALNRYGMLAMLIGCIGIFIAFRGPKWFVSDHLKEKRGRSWSPWLRLLAANAVGLVLFAIAGAVVALLAPKISWVAIVLVPILLPLPLVAAIWHRGMMRAYAIGFFCSCCISWIMLASYGMFSMYSMAQYSPWMVNGTPPSELLTASTWVSIVTTAFLASISGLACALYVVSWERWERRRAVAGDKLGTPDESIASSTQ